MIDGQKVLAIIPARGGSKGIPRKNIIEVAGKPLIAYTIEAAQQSQYIDEIHVSTDDLEIAEVVQNLGVRVDRLRPKELAEDTSKTIDAVLDVVNYYKNKGENFEIVILLQPTQPLRKVFHIDEALEIFNKNQSKSVVSVTEVEQHPVLMRQIDENGELQSILNISSTVRRQDFKPFYLVNGAIYINFAKELNANTSLNDNLVPYVMAREYHLDVDTMQDIEKLKEILSSQK